MSFTRGFNCPFIIVSFATDDNSEAMFGIESLAIVGKHQNQRVSIGIMCAAPLLQTKGRLCFTSCSKVEVAVA